MVAWRRLCGERRPPEGEGAPISWSADTNGHLSPDSGRVCGCALFFQSPRSDTCCWKLRSIYQGELFQTEAERRKREAGVIQWTEKVLVMFVCWYICFYVFFSRGFLETENTYITESGTILHCLGMFLSQVFPARAWHVIVVPTCLPQLHVSLAHILC